MNGTIKSALAAALLSVSISACGPVSSFYFNTPKANQSTPSPVAFDLAWKGALQPGTLKVDVDGTDQTQSFPKTYPPGSGHIGANIPLSDGDHVANASAQLSDGKTIDPVATSDKFTVGTPSFMLTLSPSYYAQRPGAWSVLVSVARTPPFNGDIIVDAPGVSTGLGPVNTPFKIPAGVNGGAFTLNCSQTSFDGTTIKIAGTSSDGLKTETHFALLGLQQVWDPRAAGVFKEVPMTPIPDTAKVTSEDGFKRIEVYHYPRLSTRAARVFSNNTQLALSPEIPFEPNAKGMDGAGFCTTNGASKAAVVLSGDQFTFVYFPQNDQPRTYATLMDQLTWTTGQDADVYPERVFFSPDCTMAMFLGATRSSPQSGRSPHGYAWMADLLAAPESAAFYPPGFDYASPSAQVQAEIVTRDLNKPVIIQRPDVSKAGYSEILAPLYTAPK